MPKHYIDGNTAYTRPAPVRERTKPERKPFTLVVVEQNSTHTKTPVSVRRSRATRAFRKVHTRAMRGRVWLEAPTRGEDPARKPRWQPTTQRDARLLLARRARANEFAKLLDL